MLFCARSSKVVDEPAYNSDVGMTASGGQLRPHFLYSMRSDSDRFPCNAAALQRKIVCLVITSRVRALPHFVYVCGIHAHLSLSTPEIALNNLCTFLGVALLAEKIQIMLELMLKA